jgi:hypothetical protein
VMGRAFRPGSLSQFLDKQRRASSFSARCKS